MSNHLKSMLAATCLVFLTSASMAKTIEFDFMSSNFPNPANITNPYLPLNGGPLFFVAIAEDECEISKQTLGFAGPTAGSYSVPATIDSVPVFVVRDQEWESEAEDGECLWDTAEMQEDTIDFFAEQNTGVGMGSVWYLGEDTFALPDEEEGEGPECSIDGGWRAGGDVLAGIIMLANPAPGDRYQQEFDEDNAEDMAAVLRLNGKPSIELGDLNSCLITREWTPLEPGSVEKKWYCSAQNGFPGGLALVEELKGKTLRFEYVGADLPMDLDGEFEAFPAFNALDCDDPNADPE